MDTFVQLALIEKIKRVFAIDSSIMLAFPLLSPISFTSVQLARLMAPTTETDYAAAADFSRIVNFLPRDIVAIGSDRMLWDVYRDVLTRAEVALSSIESASQISSVNSILYDIGADGNRDESEVFKRYRQYRDAWFVARENYAFHKLTGEFSEDLTIRQNWLQIEEPILRAEVDLATREWDMLGQREAVEAALTTEQCKAVNAPELRWSEWRAEFNPDIDMITDAGGNQYAPTGISPRNFAEQKNWLSFKLSGSEIKALVEAVPEKMKVVLDNNSGSNIEQVTFEYRTVSLIRPWFRPEALTSHIWRSNDPELILSNDTDSLSGACPAYVSACVFIRNIMVTEKGMEQSNSLSKFDFSVLSSQLTIPVRHIDRDEFVLREEIPLHLHRPAVNTLANARRSISVNIPETTISASNSTNLVDRVRTRSRNERNVKVFQRLNYNSFDLVQPQNTDAPIVDEMSLTKTNSPPSTLQPTSSSTTNNDEISILAFICKKLPKTPDPAPDLRWS